MEIETRQCNKCKENFQIDQDEKSFYEKMKVPVPNVCPDCRFKMRAMWRNEMALYSGQKCEMCQKGIISMYNPKLLYKNYCHDCFCSDKWDAKDYVLDYDLNKSFFSQFNKLLLDIPKVSLYISPNEGPVINSDYVNLSGGLKNCYFVFNTSVSEDFLYSRGIKNSNDSSDIYFGVNLGRCYECVNVNKSSGVIFSQNSINCVDCLFLLNCSGLTNCFGCVNLRNKSNCWFNEQLTPEEYKKRLNDVIGSYIKFVETRKKFEEFCLKFPHRENNNIKTHNSIGDYLFECNNVSNSFEVYEAENCKYLFSSRLVKDSIGTIGFGIKSERLLECVATGLSSNIIGSFGVENSHDILYSCFMNSSQDCIGCVSLKNSKYCILNKQYTKEKYEELKAHIVKELTEKGIHGLMMPVEIAPFAYNETIAQDNMPLTKEEAITQGFRWEDDIQMTKGKETLQPEEIPDHIKDVSDSITEEILKCINCERNYKITEQELLFYRKMNLPIPRQCFYCRHQDRIKRRGPYKFWDRKCDHCGKGIKTNYSPERKEIIYCEQCYQQEVV